MAAYEMLMSDWSSDVCSSDLLGYYDGTFTKKERVTHYEESGVYPCTIPAGQTLNGGGTAGVSERYDDRTGCGAAFYRRYNPSDTGNIRGASRFTLTDKLVLTVDPSYQYVQANGGGPDALRESFFTPADRKRVVEGKGLSVRYDLGGHRVIK